MDDQSLLDWLDSLSEQARHAGTKAGTWMQGKPMPQTPSTLNTNPVAKPTQQVQALKQALGGGKDIELPASGKPFQLSQPPNMSTQIGNLPPGTAQGQNGYQLPNMGFDKTANAFSDLPGYGAALQAPPDTGNFDPSSGDFLGSSYLSQTPDDPGGLSNFLKKLTGQDILGAAGLGLGAAGAFSNAATQKDQFNQQMALQQAQFGQQQAQAGLNATQLDPYAQQNDLFNTARKRDIAIHGPAQAQLGSPNTYNPSKDAIASDASQFLNDDALANAAGNFQAARSHVDPTGTPLDLSKTGLGAAGAAAQPASQQALQNVLTAGTNQQPAEVDDGGGFWHTLAKIGLMAAPIVAAPFTGGASLAAIGALSGAASGAMDGGGWKGALFGGGLGAIPGFGTPGGLASGAAKPALVQGLEQAGKKAITSPKVITSALSAALNH